MNDTTDTTEGAPAAGFEDLAQEAASLEGGPPVEGSPEAAANQAQQHQQTSTELMQALTMARMLVSPMFGWWQDFPRVWSDQTLQGIASGGAAVMLRHGWTMGDLFEKWGPYLALAMATIPPSAVTWQAIKQRQHQLQQQAQHGQRPAAAAPPPDAEGASHGSDGKAPH